MRTTKREFLDEAYDYVEEELSKGSLQATPLLTEILIAALSAIMSVLTGICLNSLFTSAHTPNQFQRLVVRNRTRRQLRDFRSLPLASTPEQLDVIASTVRGQLVEDAMVSGLLRLGRTVQQEELQTVWSQNGTG